MRRRFSRTQRKERRSSRHARHVPRRRTWILGALLAVVLLLGAGLAIALRPIEMPEPGGAYGVGRTTRVVEDADRVVDLGAGEGPRRLPVTVYYPAAKRQEEAVAYVPSAIGDELRGDMGAFAFVPGAWGRIRAHVADDAPIAPGSFPVVTFSPGIGTQPELYTTLLADIASRGHVVLSLTPTHSVPAALLDGEVVRATDVGMNMGPGTPAERTRASEAMGEVWVADILATLDAAERWNASDPALAGAIDHTRVVAVGHSFGGAAAATASARDARILASVDMDGTPFGAPDAAGTGEPSMLLEDPVLSPPGSRDAVAREAYVRNASVGYRVTIQGASHQAFVTDLAVVASRFGFIGDFGDRPPRESVRFVVDHVAAFLDLTLRGEASPLLDARDEGGVLVRAYAGGREA